MPAPAPRPIRAAAFVGVFLVACNALTGVGDLSVSSEPGPFDTGPNADADASEAPDVFDPDVVDGGGPPEAAPDAIQPVLGFCASQSPKPTLCLDFDDTLPVAPWNWVTQGAGTVLDFSVVVPFSAPRAINAKIGASGEPRWAFLTYPLAQTALRVRYSYSIYLDSLPLNNEIQINNVRFVEPSAVRDVALVIEPSGTASYVEVRGASVSSWPLSPGILLKKWTQVTLELGLVAEPRFLIVRVDGVEALRRSVPAPGAGAPQVGVGITYGPSNTGSTAIALDNVHFQILE